MLETTYLRLADAPALLVYRDNPRTAGKKGIVLFYHGVTASKESNLKELRSLAERGFLAVGIDAFGHGERRLEHLPSSLSSQNSTAVQFFEYVHRTVREIPHIIDDLASRNLGSNVGVAGFSMGGCIAYGAPLVDRRVKAACPIVATPRWNSPFVDSPHLKPANYFPCALLVQTAGRDERVPPDDARAFHEVLRVHYREAPERLAYFEYPESSHFLRENDWVELWERTLEWLERYLVGGP